MSMVTAQQFAAKLQPWFEARRRFKLSNAHIQMARELGMNPKRLDFEEDPQAPRIASLPEFIAETYRKRFGRNGPEQIRSLEELVEWDKQRRVEKQARKQARLDAPAVDAAP
jgi:hypothetical protein